MRILLIGHGALFSTYDIYNYYKLALKKCVESVKTFPYHDALDYHARAIKSDKYLSLTEAQIGRQTVMSASRDIITEIMLYEPSIVLFVSGLMIPPIIAKAVYHLRNQLIQEARYKIGYIFTESPYQDMDQEPYIDLCDFCFMNDALSVEKYNPNKDKYIDFLPHSYSPETHYISEKEEKTTDVIFCGTLYPNRMALFSAVDWSGIDIMLYGAIGIYENSDVPVNIRNIIMGNNLDNSVLAEHYRHSKLSINAHRQTRNIDDHTIIAGNGMNPRIRESIMCGCLPITDYRQEIKDVFGDVIPFFDGSEELENKVRHFLHNDEERSNRLQIAMNICKKDTYENRCNEIILPVCREVEKVVWQKS